MGEHPHIPLSYRDKHRAWQELVTAVQSADGLLLVPTQVPATRKQAVRVTVDVGDERVLDFETRVRKIRRPSPRFARGLFLELSDAISAEIKARLSELREAAVAGSLRRDQRFELAWPVRFRTPALFDWVKTLDISADGMHVEMPERVHTGDILELFLRTPQGHEIGLVGRVQWASEVSPRIGLQLIHADDDIREMFRLLLEWGVAMEGSPRNFAATMLVVGPEGENRDDLDVLTQTWGQRVSFIEGEEEALQMIRRHRPTLVLVRADMSAAAICAAVSSDAELEDIAVAIFGEADAKELAELAGQVGAQASLSLPATPERVFQLLSGLSDDD